MVNGITNNIIAIFESLSFSNHNTLDLQVVLKSLLAQLSANSWVLVSPERSGCVHCLVVVDVNWSRLQLCSHPEGSRKIICHDTCSKTILGRVHSFYHFLFTWELEHWHHRPKYFLDWNLHVVLDISKNSRFDKVSFLPDSLATNQELCSFRNPRLNVLHDGFKLILADQRTHCRARFLARFIVSFGKGVSNSDSFDVFYYFFQKRIIDFLMNKGSCVSNTALTGIEINFTALRNGLFKISIFKDNVPRFPTKFQSNSLKIMNMGFFHYIITDFGRSCKCYFVNKRAFGQIIPCYRTTPRNQIDNTIRQPSIFKISC